jgi:hypothetical protein
MRPDSFHLPSLALASSARGRATCACAKCRSRTRPGSCAVGILAYNSLRDREQVVSFKGHYCSRDSV